MKSAMIVVALALGLFAVSEAAVAASSQHLVLEGANWPMPAIDGLAADADVAHAGHHRKHGPIMVNPPSDLEAMERLLHCAKKAVRVFDADRPETWKPAAEILAGCVAHLWDSCSGTHALPGAWANTIPGFLLLNGIDALVAQGNLNHASAVLSFYLIGGVGNAGNNFWYTSPTSCSSKLLGLMKLSDLAAPNNAIFQSLAKAVVQIIVDTYHNGPAAIKDCAGDIPAVLASLAAVYCPTSGFLGNGVGGLSGNAFTPIPCGNPLPAGPGSGPLFAGSASAQLVGSVISLGILSNKPQLQALTLGVAFSAARIGLAAAQFDSALSCMGAPVLNGNNAGAPLLNSMALIPAFNPVLGNQAVPAPTVDGARTVCATIEAVRMGERGLAVGGDWTLPIDPTGANTGNYASLIYQALLNTGNAISNAAMVTGASAATKAKLCEFGAAVNLFGLAPGTVDLNCLTVSKDACDAIPLTLPSWAQPWPVAADAPNNYGPGSFFQQVCNP